MKVTLFKNVKTQEGGEDYLIEDVFGWIIDGAWQSKVDPIRLLTDKDQKANLKKELPLFTASGTFSTRKLAGLKEHSGVIAIDIDDVEDPEEAKSWLAADRFSWFTCLSVGGQGLVVFVKIQTNQHREAFEFLQEYYQQNYGITIDKACKDIPRARFVTYDPNAHKNDDAETLIIEEEAQFDQEKMLNQIEARVAASQPGERHDVLLKQSILAGGYISGNLIDESLAITRLELAFIKTPYQESYNYMKTITDGIENGKTKPINIELYRQVAKTNSAKGRKLKELRFLVREQWRNGITITEEELRTYCKGRDLDYQEAEDAVNEIFLKEEHYFAFNKKAPAIKAQILIADKFEFQNNVVKQSIDFRDAGATEWKPISFEDVWLYVQERTSAKVSIDNIKNLLRSSWVEKYDPFEEYFESLDDWDEKTDYISELCSFVETTDNEYFSAMLKKHLVRSVSCSLGKHINRYVFTFVGEKQNTGKSTLVRFLNPFPQGNYYTEAKLNENKDSLFAMSENFLYNLEELSEMTKHDVNRVKALISQWLINERRPYAHTAVTVKRRCNFYGSTNNAQFLTDTENTRWLCFEVLSIDWAYDKLDIHKIWAQAYSLYESGFDAELSKEENNIQEQSNKAYEVSDVGKDLIAKHFKPTKQTGFTNEFYSVADIIQTLSEITDNKVKFNERSIGKSLVQLGFAKGKQYINKNQVRGYWAQRITGVYSGENAEQTKAKF